MSKYTTIVLMIPFLVAEPSFSLPGNLDPTFNSPKGYVIYGTQYPQYGQDAAYAVAVQPDGKIIVAGSGIVSEKEVLLILRYNNDGTLDNTFGTGGRVTFNSEPPCGVIRANAVTVEADGKILIAGGVSMCFSSPDDYCVILRYTKRGVLDKTFGTHGAVISNGGGMGVGIAIQADKKILVLTTQSISRYDRKGRLDSSFGTGGIVTLIDVQGKAVALQPDGKIVIVGRVWEDWGSQVVVLRNNGDGTPDHTFGMGGIASFSNGIPGREHFGTGVSIQPDGKIVISGGTTLPQEIAILPFSPLPIQEALILRYNGDGTLDTTFGEDGVASYRIGYNYALTLQADGKIVTTGVTTSRSLLIPLIIRYTAQGKLDTSFAKGGVIDYYPPEEHQGGGYGQGIAIGPDRKTMVVGFSYKFDVYPYIWVARLISGNEPLPDIAGEWKSLIQACRIIESGQECKLNGKLKIRNAGDLDSPVSSVRFYLSETGIYNEGSSFLLMQVGTGNIKKGRSKTIEFSYRFPLGETAMGKYIIALIDPDDMISEADESNNTVVFGPIEPTL